MEQNSDWAIQPKKSSNTWNVWPCETNSHATKYARSFIAWLLIREVRCDLTDTHTHTCMHVEG